MAEADRSISSSSSEPDSDGTSGTSLMLSYSDRTDDSGLLIRGLVKVVDKYLPGPDEFNRWTDLQHADYYVSSRPPYEKVVIPWLMEYYRRKNPTDRSPKVPLAIDVACGSGQLTRKLAEYCDRVIAVDISPAMIVTAQRFNWRHNIDYRVGSIHDLRDVCGGEKANIVTVGMAINFFHSKEFFKKIKQVLVDGGVFGVFGYRTPGFDYHGLETFLDDYIHEQFLNEKYRSSWLTLRRYYSNIQVPFEDEERRVFSMNVSMAHNQIRSWLLSYPKDSKDGQQAIDEAMRKLPPARYFDLICDVIGIITSK